MIIGISDWICNCCQRPHDFFTSCQSVIK